MDLPSPTRLPAVERLLGHPDLVVRAGEHGRSLVTEAVRAVLAEIRAARLPAPPLDALAQAAQDQLDAWLAPSLRPVFNLTGTVLHTNLGRALLPAEAARAVTAAMTRPTNLEFDLATGRRGERDAHAEALVCRLTGAEAATVVNNNAAAVLLVLTALARRREVPVSRGELVEIGGAFRMPDVMARAGCRLVEVGTTNRTHLADYAAALGPRTGLVMRVHPSNYAIHGFAAAPEAAALHALCRERGLPFAVDLGSGALVDLSAYGLPREPVVAETLRHADLVLFSGDKLLGGVQCGIVAGRADLVARVRRDPLKRALRVDKMTLAALEAVLRLYLQPERLRERLPTLRLLTRPQAEIREEAERLAPVLSAALGAGTQVAVEACLSQVGSGSLPVETLPSAALVLRPAGGRASGAWPERLAARFRALPVPVLGRIADGALRLDLRALDDEPAFAEQLRDAHP
ncbi:L-seryl-tRNA(Sec) selenium transferase [Methylobacterium sp. JK268]